MTSKLTQMKDHATGVIEYLDPTTGDVWADPEGLRPLRRMEPTEYVAGGSPGAHLRDGAGRLLHISNLVLAANEHYYRQEAELVGKSRKLQMRDETGRLVAMDLGVADVHTAATIPNYAAGYRIADGIADAASPVVTVGKQSNVYYTWSQQSDFNRKLGVGSSPGGAPPEFNPSLSPATYTAPEYALAGFLPTEVIANADTPLQPSAKLTQVLVDALKLEREYRVATLMQNSANWNANLVTTIAAGAQWDGGAASDPVANLHHAMEQSYMPVTGIFWSELVEHDFLRNPAVQKFFTYKDMVDGLPDPSKLSSVLRLPPIYTAKMKYTTNGGQLQYVWGNHVVLVRQPSQQPPTTQMDVATSYTFRWTGATAPDGSATGGFLVRTYYRQDRGARGGTQVVVVHNDAELMTSGLVGGLLLNAHQ